MIQISENNFAEMVREDVSVVDFSATWCGPCRLLTPIMEEVQNANVYKVDVDMDGTLASQFRVSSIPCLIFFKDGVEQSRLVGFQTKEAIQKVVDQLNGQVL